MLFQPSDLYSGAVEVRLRRTVLVLHRLGDAWVVGISPSEEQKAISSRNADAVLVICERTGRLVLCYLCPV